MKPYYQDDAVTLYHGEALRVLSELPDASVDAIVADPPYSSGGMMRSDRSADPNAKYRGWSQGADGESVAPAAAYQTFTGDNRDQRSYHFWSALWLSEALRVTKPGGTLLTFTDWRQLPTTTDAVQSGGWVWRAIAVWDKGIGRPMKGRFRNHVEYVVWATAGALSDPQNVYLDSVLRHSPPGHGDRVHLTEKPVPLIRYLLDLVPAGGTVLDPFMGSGTTGVACVETGRKFIGIEMSKHYAEVARQRITKPIEVTLL